MSFEVYWCPPYSLRLSEESCAKFNALAVEAAKHPRREGSTQVLLSKRSCIDCVGVRALAKMWRLEPEEIEVKPSRIVRQWRGDPRPKRQRKTVPAMHARALREGP